MKNNKTAVHHHFELAVGMLKKPTYYKQLGFSNIPFFRLYSGYEFNYIMNNINALSLPFTMPRYLQEILKKLKPPDYRAYSHYREEIVPIRYCKYNNQEFFLRTYRLREKDFVKIEITFISKSLGPGKHLNFKKYWDSAEKVFQFLESGVEALPLSLHLPEYFLCADFEKQVRVFEKKLSFVKESKNPSSKHLLKENFITELKGFQKNAKEIAAVRLLSQDLMTVDATKKQPP